MAVFVVFSYSSFSSLPVIGISIRGLCVCVVTRLCWRRMRSLSSSIPYPLEEFCFKSLFSFFFSRSIFVCRPWKLLDLVRNDGWDKTMSFFFHFWSPSKISGQTECFDFNWSVKLAEPVISNERKRKVTFQPFDLFLWCGSEGINLLL